MEEDGDTDLCGAKGLITLEEQNKFIIERRKITAAEQTCEKYKCMLQETHQQLDVCQAGLDTLTQRRHEVEVRLLDASTGGQRALCGYLQDQLTGVGANIEQQQHNERQLTDRLVSLEKFAAAAAFEDGKLININFFVNRMENTFAERKAAQKTCYINREAKLAQIYQDKVRQQTRRQAGAQRALRARERLLREQAVDASQRIGGHIANTLAVLKTRQQQQRMAAQQQQRRRSEAVCQFARQLEYSREVIRVQRQQTHGEESADTAAPRHTVSDGSAKLQAVLLRKREALQCAEQRQRQLASRQRDNMRHIVSRLVQQNQERRRPRQPTRAVPPRAHRSRRSLPSIGQHAADPAADPAVDPAADPDADPDADDDPGTAAESAASPSPAGSPESAPSTVSTSDGWPGGGDGDSEHSSSLLMSADERRRLQLLLESAVGGQHEQSSSRSQSPSLSQSLTETERLWTRRRPDLPQLAPAVTSRPCPFSWKPDVIEFKDFQVGWTYHRRVAIVNLSATRSSCRYLGLYEEGYYELHQPLADMLTVKFSPPGFLGTGLSARLELEFTPRVLSDGWCVVRFRAPNGEFHVPVRFVAQRCTPRLDRRSVQFGDLVLGVRVRRSLVLRNAGSKGCRYVFRSTEVTPAASPPSTDAEGGGAAPPLMEASSQLPPSDSMRSQSAASTASAASAGSPDAADDVGSAALSTAMVGSILQQLFDRLPIIDFDGGLGVCGSGEGELPAHGRVHLYLGCVADLAGRWQRQFVVEFDDPSIEPLSVTASYSGHVFPITVRNPHLSLDICLCGVTYWDNFHIVNSGKVASRVQTVVPDDMKPFVEIQGAAALVQADSCFKVKIYFKPNRALLSPSHRFFDPATHVLDFPVAFLVAGRSLRGSVQAAVSSNNIWLRPDRIDLGRVTLLESACGRVYLTNGGLTGQRYQFNELPDSVSVQPGDGGGYVLPGETTPLDIIFSPSVAGQQQFTLVVETLDGGRATVVCRCLATTPALSFSSTSVRMSGVPVGGEVKAAVYVQCPKAPLQEEKVFSGGGSFEFQLPDGIPVRLHPLVGFVPYTQSRRVDVVVTPRLDRSEVQVTAAIIKYERLEVEETSRLKEESDRPSRKKKTSKSRPKSSSPKRQTVLCPEPSTIGVGSTIYREAEQVSQREHKPTTRRYVVPCCVRHGPLDRPSCGVPDVLYLELVVTTAAPQLVAMSPLCVAFGARVVDVTGYLPLQLENAGRQRLAVSSAALDPHGPFRLVDPLTELEPGQQLTARLGYQPTRLSQELEFWEVRAGNTSLRFALCGRGVKQEFSFTPEDGVLTLGKAKLGGSVKKQVVVTNLCDAPLGFAVQLTGEPPALSADAAAPPTSGKAARAGTGASRSARSERPPQPPPQAPQVWSVSCDWLVVEPGQSADLEVELTPAEEALYEARLLLTLFGKLDQIAVRVVGKTKGYKAPKVEKVKRSKSPNGKQGGEDASKERSGKGKKKKK